MTALKQLPLQKKPSDSLLNYFTTPHAKIATAFGSVLMAFKGINISSNITQAHPTFFYKVVP